MSTAILYDMLYSCTHFKEAGDLIYRILTKELCEYIDAASVTSVIYWPRFYDKTQPTPLYNAELWSMLSSCKSMYLTFTT